MDQAHDKQVHSYNDKVAGAIMLSRPTSPG
jgi:hypothetical protein